MQYRKDNNLYAGKQVLEIEKIIRSHMNDVPDICVRKCEEVNCSEKENSWISISERLPEVPEGTEDDDCPEFNVTIKGASKATTLKYAPDGTWFDDSGEVYNVMAWQPLPEPYRPEE